MRLRRGKSREKHSGDSPVPSRPSAPMLPALLPSFTGFLLRWVGEAAGSSMAQLDDNHRPAKGSVKIKVVTFYVIYV